VKHEGAEARAEAMWRERQSGASLAEIGTRHGCSRQRVHQILYGEAPFPPKRPMGRFPSSPSTGSRR